MPTKVKRRRRKAPVGKRNPRKMTTPAQQSNIIDEIDARQNDVLDQLDQLNRRVEALLQECTADSGE